MDLDTNLVKLQYLEVSDPSEAVSGVENSTGTEATQYAYGDPNLIANDTAVVFYPAFGTPPPQATLSGLITDSQSGDPIEDAWAFATAASTGTTYYFNTDSTGNYTGALCPDDYDVWADKAGYAQSAVFPLLGVVDGSTNVQDFVLDPVPGFTYTPEVLTATIDGESTFESLLTFGNTGSGMIDYSLVITPAVTWLSVEPITGTISPGVDEELTVTFDSTGLSAGVYEAVVQVATTDPEFLLVDIPAILTVTCTGVSELDFSFAPEAPVTGDVVTFQAVASGTLPILYAWDFGDGGTGMGEVVTHTFEAAGTYTVTLSAGNCGGDDIQVQYTVTVTAGTMWVYLPVVYKH